MWLLSLIAGYWQSIAAFVLFGALHSLFVQEPFKEALGRWTSPFFVEHFWRFVYCGLSFIALYHGISVLHWGGHPAADVWVIPYPDWFWRILLVLHLLSIVLIYVAFLQSDYLEFWGFKQMWRGGMILLRIAPPSSLELFGTHRLVISGIYGWVRHPMLSAGLLFLITGGPSQNNLVFLGMYVSYMLVGAYFEERRLVRMFGERYRRYREEVGAFVPKWRRRAKAAREPGNTPKGGG